MTTTAEERTLGSATTDPRTLVPADLFDRLVRRIVKDEQTDQATAERIMGQALAFLKACAVNPGVGLSPSPAVDIGWHTFILHTREYASFCEQVAGRFIHHAPTDGDACGHSKCVDTDCSSRTAGNSSPAAPPVAATVAAMRSAGLPVDAELWRPGPADCSQCHAGCHDSPS